MTSGTLIHEISKAIPRLLDIASGLTFNQISDNCKFILTQIKNSEENAHVQRMQRKIENDKKVPVELYKIMPELLKIYADLYDINLFIYRSTEDLTIVDIRYYSKSSLDPEYQDKVKDNPPMLHCKVAHPYWLTDKNEKFDINWEHEEELKLKNESPKYPASVFNEETKETFSTGYKLSRRLKTLFFLCILVAAIIYFIITIITTWWFIF